MPELTPTPEQRLDLLERPLSLRVGSRVPENVYDESTGGSRPFVQCHSAEDARRLVAAANLAPSLVREVERLTKAIEAAPCAPDCASRSGITKCDKCGCRSDVLHAYQKCHPFEWVALELPCNCWKAALAAGKETNADRNA